jgi:hypothetical protein
VVFYDPDNALGDHRIYFKLAQDGKIGCLPETLQPGEIIATA